MPKIVDHAARRTEIVHGLWLVIYTRGIDAVTFRSVAEAAGISIGRVQHYFPSREGLILEGCRQLVAGAELEEVEVNEDGADPADPIAALSEFLHAFIPEGEAMRVGASVWFTYIAKAVGDSSIAEVIVDTDRRTEEAAVRRVERVLTQASRSGPADHSARSVAEEAAECAVRLVALAKGLAQEVMLEVRTPETAYGILDAEIEHLGEAAARN